MNTLNAYSRPYRHKQTVGADNTASINEDTLVLYTEKYLRQSAASLLASRLDFKTITQDDMSAIWEILKDAPGRTTDFSYGGILMWVDVYKYEFAILDNTLFIKGRVENDTSLVAFSLPVGAMDFKSAIDIIREYCRIHNLKMIFSAVPEFAIEQFKDLNPSLIAPLDDMADYLYSASSLATLSGKNNGKKRNHINQFIAACPDWSFEPLTPVNVADAIKFMDKIDVEGDMTAMAVTERRLNRQALIDIQRGDKHYIGGILRTGGNPVAFTVGDIKGDTLFVHIEKALREVPGAFEMINKVFADDVCRHNPQIQFINREDDAGDIGLRLAKQSYHPVDMLRKYNVIF